MPAVSCFPDEGRGTETAPDMLNFLVFFGRVGVATEMLYQPKGESVVSLGSFKLEEGCCY